ncbi:MAG: hypothetical protein ACM3SQ_12630 [Betaproteobacteria bacterium]
MARELSLGGRRYWILSEPCEGGWRASVVEVAEDGETADVGIVATDVTRGAADAGAERKLRRLLRTTSSDPSTPSSA